jgi:hypothetical protein
MTMADYDVSIPGGVEFDPGHDGSLSPLETPNLDTSDIEGDDEDHLGFSNDNEPPPQDFLADERLLQVIGKDMHIESNFCTSIRTNHDDTSSWVRPTCKERMLGVSAIIERDCGIKFTIATIIGEIADWRINNKGCRLNVTIKIAFGRCNEFGGLL